MHLHKIIPAPLEPLSLSQALGHPNHDGDKKGADHASLNKAPNHHCGTNKPSSSVACPFTKPQLVKKTRRLVKNHLKPLLDLQRSQVPHAQTWHHNDIKLQFSSEKLPPSTIISRHPGPLLITDLLHAAHEDLTTRATCLGIAKQATHIFTALFQRLSQTGTAYQPHQHAAFVKHICEKVKLLGGLFELTKTPLFSPILPTLHHLAFSLLAMLKIAAPKTSYLRVRVETDTGHESVYLYDFSQSLIIQTLWNETSDYQRFASHVRGQRHTYSDIHNQTNPSQFLIVLFDTFKPYVKPDFVFEVPQRSDADSPPSKKRTHAKLQTIQQSDATSISDRVRSLLKIAATCKSLAAACPNTFVKEKAGTARKNILANLNALQADRTISKSLELPSL